MKVLMINSVCGIRSTGRICTDLADVLISEGHECKIAYGRESIPEKYQDIAIRIGTEMDVRLHGLKSRLFDRHGLGSKRATKRFVEWIKEYDPDVIHLHNLHGYYINIEVLFDYLKTCGKKIVWTLHDCWAFTGHCSYFTNICCEKWKADCENCKHIKRYPKSCFINNSKTNFGKKKELYSNLPNLTVVTPSKWLADLTGESILKNANIKVVHNGIDFSNFNPYADAADLEKYGLQDKKIVLGVASIWDKRKGLEDLVKLAGMLNEEYCVVLVGLTNEQINALPEGVVGIKRTNSVKELSQLYANAIVFVNPTYEDNFPTTNIEALACGTPVITYKTGGSPEALDDSCGWVLKQGDLDAVLRIIEEIEEKDKYTDACLKRSENFDKKRMCKQYLDIYSE